MSVQTTNLQTPRERAGIYWLMMLEVDGERVSGCGERALATRSWATRLSGAAWLAGALVPFDKSLRLNEFEFVQSSARARSYRSDRAIPPEATASPCVGSLARLRQASIEEARWPSG